MWFEIYFHLNMLYFNRKYKPKRYDCPAHNKHFSRIPEKWSTLMFTEWSWYWLNFLITAVRVTLQVLTTSFMDLHQCEHSKQPDLMSHNGSRYVNYLSSVFLLYLIAKLKGRGNISYIPSSVQLWWPFSASECFYLPVQQQQQHFLTIFAFIERRQALRGLQR